MSVIHNTQRPESMLKKKSNSICYHTVRESVAMGESLTAHIGTNENVGDLATKVLYGQDVSTDRQLKTSRVHIGQPKPAILEASVSVDTMADFLGSIDVTRSGG